MHQRLINVTKNINRIGEVASCMRQTAQWATLVPAFTLQRRLEYPFNFRTRSGASIRLASWDDLTTVWHVFFGAEYLIPKDSRTILDLGANIGSFSVWAAFRCPCATVYSIEPFPERMALLSHKSFGGNELPCFPKVASFLRLRERCTGARQFIPNASGV